MTKKTARIAPEENAHSLPNAEIDDTAEARASMAQYKEKHDLPKRDTSQQKSSNTEKGQTEKRLAVSISELHKEKKEKEMFGRSRTLNDKKHIPERSTKWIESWKTDSCIALVVLFNAVTIGWEADMKSDNPKMKTPWYFAAFEIVFCLIFTVELTIRFYHIGMTYLDHCDRKGAARYTGLFYEIFHVQWNVIDFIIVILSILDTFLLQFMQAEDSGDTGLISPVPAQMIRRARMLRLVRLVKLLKVDTKLQLFVTCLTGSLRSFYLVLLILIAAIYCLAMLTTIYIGHDHEFYNDYYMETGWDSETWFEYMGRSMWTLFQVITHDNWNETIVRHAIRDRPFMSVIFVPFMLFGGFGVLNTVVAVVVQKSLDEMKNEEKELRRKKERDTLKVFDQLREIFVLADSNGSGSLSLEEVQRAVDHPEIINKLRMIGFSIDDPERVFNLLDFDGSGEVAITEFISGWMRTRGDATSKDLLTCQVAFDGLKAKFNEIEAEHQKLEDTLAKMKETTLALQGQGEFTFLSVRQYKLRHSHYKANDMPEIPPEQLSAAPWTAPNGDIVFDLSHGNKDQALGSLTDLLPEVFPELGKGVNRISLKDPTSRMKEALGFDGLANPPNEFDDDNNRLSVFYRDSDDGPDSDSMLS